MSSSSFVTSSGVTGEDLVQLIRDVSLAGFTYEEALTDRTAIVVAQPTGGKLSQKMVEALQRLDRIVVVTRAWTLEGKCAAANVARYRVSKELFGARVCTTSLTERQRSAVQHICRNVGALYAAALCRNCAYLVVANSGTDPSNEKVKFAKRHPHIQMETYAEFVNRFHDVVGLPRESSLSLVTPLRHVVCFVTPPEAVTPEVRVTLARAGVQRVPQWTRNTTHIVVLEGSNVSSVRPRPDQEVVSIDWLRDCLAEQREVPTTKYRRTLCFVPTITFGSLDDTERVEVRGRLVDSPSLKCHVQDTLVLGSDVPRGGNSDVQLLRTTHLVVPRERMATSKKVFAVLQRYLRVKRAECQLVDVSWVSQSLLAQRWLDTVPFEVSYHEVQRLAAQGPCSDAVDDAECVAAAAIARLSQPPCLSAKHGRPSLDAEQLNLSLETLVGQLERRLGHAEAAEAHFSMTVGEPPGPAEGGASLVIGPSFASGLSPLISNESLCVPYAARRLPLAHTAGGGGPESQVVVFRCSQHTPQRRANALGSTRVDGGQTAEAPLGLPPPGQVEPPARVLVTKSLRDNGSLMAQFVGAGAVLVDAVDKATHFVVNRPTKSETFLCMVAGGKWVVQASYITDFIQRGGVGVSSETHEWTSLQAQTAGISLDSGGTSTRTLSMVGLLDACRLQRLRRMSAPGNGPFAGWRVVLTCTTDARAQSFERVLQCGGCATVFIGTSDCITAAAEAYRCSGVLALWPDKALPTHILTDDSIWVARDADMVESILNCRLRRMEFLVHSLCQAAPSADPAVALGGTLVPPQGDSLEFLAIHAADRKRGREAIC